MGEYLPLTQQPIFVRESKNQKYSTYQDFHGPSVRHHHCNDVNLKNSIYLVYEIMDGQNSTKYISSIMDNIFEKIPVTTAPAVREYLLLTQQPIFVRESKNQKYSTYQGFHGPCVRHRHCNDKNLKNSICLVYGIMD